MSSSLLDGKNRRGVEALLTPPATIEPTSKLNSLPNGKSNGLSEEKPNGKSSDKPEKTNDDHDKPNEKPSDKPLSGYVTGLVDKARAIKVTRICSVQIGGKVEPEVAQALSELPEGTKFLFMNDALKAWLIRDGRLEGDLAALGKLPPDNKEV